MNRSITQYMTETWRIATDAYRANKSQKMREAKPVVGEKVLQTNMKPEMFGDPINVIEEK
jgi:hypothetical protein